MKKPGRESHSKRDRNTEKERKRERNTENKRRGIAKPDGLTKT